MSVFRIVDRSGEKLARARPSPGPSPPWRPNNAARRTNHHWGPAGEEGRAMPLLRFRTTSLMAAVAALGVALAALRYASDAWAAGLFTATLLVFAAALLGAI